MRDFGKVFSRIWESADFRALSEDGRALVLYLLTCPHGTIAGVFRVPDGYACEDLQWGSERVAKGFAELSEKGFATRCEGTKWVWVCKFLEWNPLENPNQVKSAVKVANGVPDSCGWKPVFMRVYGPLLGLTQPDELNPFGTLSEPFRNQEQEQEQEQEKKEDPDGSRRQADSKLPDCPHDEIVSLYHEKLPELPKVKLKTESRQKAVRSFWRWVLTSKRSDGQPRANDADQALTWCAGYFERVQGNDFLMGRNRAGRGHENWQCDFDFLLTERGRKHVIEKTREPA